MDLNLSRTCQKSLLGQTPAPNADPKVSKEDEGA